MTGSAAFFRAANIITLDYPFAAAIQSALAVVDEACIVIGQSQDATRDAVYKLQDQYGADRFKVREEIFVFDRGWQERWWTTCAEMTTADWRLWLDLDEIIMPVATTWLRETIENPLLFLVRFPFVHFYGTAYHTGAFKLTRNTRLGRASMNYRMVNMCDDFHPQWSACAMRVGNADTTGVDAHSYDDVGIVDSPWPILHYGWCRTPQALAISQAKHFAWYADGDGLQDGRVPDVPPYDLQIGDKLASGWAQPYVGTHPAGIVPWLDSHIEAWREMAQEAALVQAVP